MLSLSYIKIIVFPFPVGFGEKNQQQQQQINSDYYKIQCGNVYKHQNIENIRESNTECACVCVFSGYLIHVYVSQHIFWQQAIGMKKKRKNKFPSISLSLWFGWLVGNVFLVGGC